MCWPLSGGGGGSPSRSGSVCTAPPSVGRASCRSTSCAGVHQLERRRQPGQARRRRPRPSPQSPARRSGASSAARAAAAVEDVEAARLDPLQRRLGRGRRTSPTHARAAAVEVGEQRRAPPRGTPRARAAWYAISACHAGVSRPAAMSSSVTPKRGQLVLRDVDAAELPVLVDVAHDVDQLQRDPERLRPLRLVGAVHARCTRPRPRPRRARSTPAARRRSS